MLRSEVALRPPRTGIEFHAEEVSYLPKHAVFHFPRQFAVGIGDVERASERHRAVYLKARTGKGTIFQVGYASPRASVLILPLDVDQVGAQHPRFYSAIQHILLCLSVPISRWISALALGKNALQGFK